MKTDNVFRFVALRGPDPREGRASPTVLLEDDESFVDEIRRRVAAGEVPERARAAVASEFMNSERYVTRNSVWLRLMQVQERVERLLEDARSSPSAPNFRLALQRLLEAFFEPGLDLERLVQSDTFREMRLDFWNSYYSNVILSKRRPQDRADLLFWIRLIDLIPNLWDDAGFEQRLRDLETARPVAPHELAPVLEKVGEKGSQPGQQAEEIVRQRRLKIEALESELEQTRAALADVRAVYRARLSEAETKASALDPLKQKPQGDPLAGHRDAPWQLKESDLKPGTREALKSLGLPVTHTTAPELLRALQVRAAQVHSRLHHARRVVEIVVRRGTFVRIRRKKT